jgi:ppGpp synthetase/RelA/SpoT-type nucleotidyltranferase
MEDLKEFYSQNMRKYESAAQKIEGIINEIIKSENIQIHSVSRRVKTLDSYLKKAERYKNPKEEIMDYIGVRVITYVISDMEKVSNIIEKEFNVDKKNSINKSKELGNDRMGYRSIHYIASINDKRKALPEYSSCNDCIFEIQIRTILQHSWAEVEHDNYKYSGELPHEIKRRLNLLSAVLEAADNEFNTISQEIDNYIKYVNNEIEENNLADIEINTASLREFIMNRYGKYNIDNDMRDDNILINELNDFGIKNLKEIEEIINQEYLDYLLDSNRHINITGFLRNVMIIKDAQKYFNICYKDSWNVLSSRSKRIYEKFAPKALSIIKNKDILIPS